MNDDALTLDDARRRLDLSIYDLWLRYIGVGGRRDAFEIRDHLAGNHGFSDSDHDHLALALNEAIHDAGGDHPLPYRRP